MKSIIYSLSKENFQLLVSSKNYLADILRHFNLHVGAGNYKTLHKRIVEENIDINHININQNMINRIKIPLSDILIENSTYQTSGLKKRLLKENLLKNKCAVCNLDPEWNGSPLSLQIDHINGISNDHRIKNLRIICPNCHSQTSNFSGRNSSLSKKHKCLDCSAIINHNCQRCLECSSKLKSSQLKDTGTKIVWPKTNILLEMIKLNGFCGAGRLLGVSDNAIRKRIKNFSE